jgi:hypothetical protein
MRRLSPLSVPLFAALAAACGDGGGSHGTLRVQLVQYPSCSALEADIKQRALDELEMILDGYGYYGGGPGGVDDGGAPESGDAGGGGRQEGTDFSGTNNQEEGVDEADLVKTDGYRIYLVDGNGLHVFGVPQFGQLVPQGTTPIEGHPSQLLLDSEHGRAAVFSMVYVDSLPEDHPMRNRVGRSNDTGSPWFWRTGALSKVTVLDLSDADQPAVEREIWLEGWYQTARRTGSSARLVVNSQIMIPGLDDWWSYAYDDNGNPLEPDAIRAQAAARIAAATIDDLIPRVYTRLPDGSLSTRTLAGSNCRSFYYPTDSVGRGTTSIVSLDLASPAAAIDADTVVSNWATVYASTDRLYLAESAWDWWWPWRSVVPGQLFTPATNLHAFDITQPGRSSYVASGRIDGTVINQFALDEEDGYLRVAATTQSWRMWSDDGREQAPPPPPESHVYVLAETGNGLVTIGHVGGIAPNERIFAARFLGDRGFVVTFEQIDPLFTLDLSVPHAPRLVGELEIPGFSTYLHPIAGDRLLAIGVGGDENGANWRTQISMFDVSNFAAPSLVDTEELVSTGWGWSEAMYEHKAFQYFAPKQLLAVPMSSYTESWDADGYHYDWSSRLELIEVGESGLSRRGTIDHSAYYDQNVWWGSADVRRSIFMGDYIYTVSSRALTVHRLSDLGMVTDAELPLPAEPYWWW